MKVRCPFCGREFDTKEELKRKIMEIIKFGCRRYSHIHSVLNIRLERDASKGISTKTLSKLLKELVESGMLKKEGKLYVPTKGEGDD